MNKTVHLSRYTVVLIFLATLTGHLGQVSVIYISVLLHEMAHLYMCKKQKIPTAYMAIYPYGMELRLKKLTNAKEQIAISIAGPMVNFLLFFFGIILMRLGVQNRYISFFVSGNLVLGVFNLLPCSPLDGSEILRSIISSKKGIIYSYTAINRVSSAVSFILLICAFLMAFYGENISLMIVLVIIRQGMAAKKGEQLLAAKKVLVGEIVSKKRYKVFWAKQGQSAATYIKRISFDYTIIVMREEKPPLCQKQLIEAVKVRGDIKIEDI